VHIHLESPGRPCRSKGKFHQYEVLIEGEEEVGSRQPLGICPENKRSLKRTRSSFRILDVGKGVPSITYGLRGLNYYQIELIGPERDLHSVSMVARFQSLTILTSFLQAS